MMIASALRRDAVDHEKVEECLHELQELKEQYPEEYQIAVIYNDEKLQQAINILKEENNE